MAHDLPCTILSPCENRLLTRLLQFLSKTVFHVFHPVGIVAVETNSVRAYGRGAIPPVERRSCGG